MIFGEILFELYTFKYKILLVPCRNSARTQCFHRPFSSEHRTFCIFHRHFFSTNNQRNSKLNGY